jgi:hypothetical protein
MDLRSFMESLTIIDKSGRLVPLIMNRSQEMVFEKLMACRDRKQPARFICLKSRQMGISTLIEAFIFALVTLLPHRKALLAAHSINAAQTIFAMTRRFYHHLPRELQRPLSRNTVRSLEYRAPHQSRIQIDTAANATLGRGETIHYVHAGETAFWDRPEEPILAINQAVPRHWDTLVFWESTANGVQNLFHRTWIAANRGDTDMEPIFLSWKGFPEYSLPAAHSERVELSPDEAVYARDHGLSAGQMKWAVHVMKSQFHGSWEKFHQEYPVSPELAFVFTGMPWFDQAVLAHMLEHTVKPPVFAGRLEYQGGETITPMLVPDPAGPLRIWKMPDETSTYTVGMDVGEGVGADYTVMAVLCRETGELVATYRSNRVPPEAAGMDAYLLGALYGYGLLGIERNGPGLASLIVCQRGTSRFPVTHGYPHLYYQNITDQRVPRETQRLGWLTTSISKQAMLAGLAESLRSGSLIIFCASTVLSLQGFVWDAERHCHRQMYKVPGERVAHDDDIMALAIAEEMRAHGMAGRFMPIHIPAGDF